MNPCMSLKQSMRSALAADKGLISLLGGNHVFDEVEFVECAPFVRFGPTETRDWSVMDKKAHEHFVTIDVATNERSRSRAQNICNRIEAVLDNASLTLTGHKLINLRVVFWSVARIEKSVCFGGTIRFRAATEPLTK